MPACKLEVMPLHDCDVSMECLGGCLCKQGGIIRSSVFIILIGASGALSWLLKFISPITVRF